MRSDLGIRINAQLHCLLLPLTESLQIYWHGMHYSMSPEEIKTIKGKIEKYIMGPTPTLGRTSNLPNNKTAMSSLKKGKASTEEELSPPSLQKSKEKSQEELHRNMFLNLKKSPNLPKGFAFTRGGRIIEEEQMLEYNETTQKATDILVSKIFGRSDSEEDDFGMMISRMNKEGSKTNIDNKVDMSEIKYEDANFTTPDHEEKPEHEVLQTDVIKEESEKGSQNENISEGIITNQTNFDRLKNMFERQPQTVNTSMAPGNAHNRNKLEKKQSMSSNSPHRLERPPHLKSIQNIQNMFPPKQPAAVEKPNITLNSKEKKIVFSDEKKTGKNNPNGEEEVPGHQIDSVHQQQYKSLHIQKIPIRKSGFHGTEQNLKEKYQVMVKKIENLKEKVICEANSRKQHFYRNPGYDEIVEASKVYQKYSPLKKLYELNLANQKRSLRNSENIVSKPHRKEKPNLTGSFTGRIRKNQPDTTFF